VHRFAISRWEFNRTDWTTIQSDHCATMPPTALRVQKVNLFPSDHGFRIRCNFFADPKKMPNRSEPFISSLVFVGASADIKDSFTAFCKQNRPELFTFPLDAPQSYEHSVRQDSPGYDNVAPSTLPIAGGISELQNNLVTNPGTLLCTPSPLPMFSL
jgi:hypothetical protein